MQAAQPARRLATALSLALTLAFAAVSTAQAADQANSDTQYIKHNLVSDGFEPAAQTDANLINPWGMAFNPTGDVWVANAGSSTSTLYDGNGKANSLIVQIPTPTAATGGIPTGMVFNATSDFAVSKSGGTPAAAKFLFVTAQGVIAGWSPTVDPTHAVVAIDHSPQGASFTGIAISASSAGSRLYAADFANAKIRVYDGNFKDATLVPGGFIDPNLPAGFAPFNVQAIGGNVYVTYAKANASKSDVEKQPGLGYVDVYGPNGKLLQRVAGGGALNAPWGVALAPAGFGPFANSLLIGNFGDGAINAYDPLSGHYLGALIDQNNRPLKIDGLWAIGFGNGYVNQAVNTLFFTAGAGDEHHGLYGRLDPAHFGNVDETK